jgi:hypothetical protein
MYGTSVWESQSMTIAATAPDRIAMQARSPLTGSRVPAIFMIVGLLTLACGPASGNPPIASASCTIEKSGQNLTPDEREAARKLNNKLDVVVAEYLIKWGPPSKLPELPRRDPATAIDWPQAKRLILNGLVVTVIQHRSRDVWIISTSGKTYMTQETAPDEVVRIVRVVDPCELFITFISD